MMMFFLPALSPSGNRREKRLRRRPKENRPGAGLGGQRRKRLNSHSSPPPFPSPRGVGRAGEMRLFWRKAREGRVKGFCASPLQGLGPWRVNICGTCGGQAKLLDYLGIGDPGTGGNRERR